MQENGDGTATAGWEPAAAALLSSCSSVSPRSYARTLLHSHTPTLPTL